MKKLISILLIVILMLSVVSVTAFAETEENDNLYEVLFVNRYLTSDYYSYIPYYDYDELYYHYDENGDIDWALIYECSYNSPPWNYHSIYKDRILTYGDYSPFCFCYGIYDVKNDEFLDVFKTPSIFEKYEGLEEVVDMQQPGYPIGDADKDKKLTILDATYVQRAMAGLCGFDDNDEVLWYYGIKSWDEVGLPKYISDIDADGERTVMDATAIQKLIAKQ